MIGTGEVIKVLREENRVIVKDVNLVKKHVKEIPNVREGGIYELEAPIHISNVMLLCPHLPTITHNNTFTAPITPITIHHTILHKLPKP